jgi:hypothetical protein
MSKRGVYISFIHTHNKLQWSNEVEVIESCNVIDKVNNFHERSASAIIDVLGRSFYKKRISDLNYDKLMAHFAKTYPAQKQALDRYLEEKGHDPIDWGDEAVEETVNVEESVEQN